MFQSEVFIGGMRDCYYEHYAKQIFMLSLAVYLYTIVSILGSGRIIVHSYAFLLIVLTAHYHTWFYVNAVDSWPLATLCEGINTMSSEDLIEISCLLLQMRHLPELQLLHIDIYDEEIVDEIIEMRISLC